MTPALLLAGLAAAGELAAWDALGDAELLEATGRYAEAAAAWEELAANLPPDDVERAEALWHLGRLYARLARPTEAAAAFEDCLRVRAWRTRCLDEREELELERSAVTALPVRWTFDDTRHGLIHPGEGGSTRLVVPSGESDPALVWTSRASRGALDQLAVGVRLTTPPTRVGFEAWATGQRGWLVIRAIDLDGREYALQTPIAIGTGAPQRFDLDLVNLVDATGAPLDPASLRRLLLEDHTAILESPMQERALILDDFTLE